MRIALYTTTILELGGGFGKYLIETARDLSESNNIEIDIVTMDDKFTVKIVSRLSLFYFKKMDKPSIYKEPLEKIKQKLGEANYYKIDTLKNLRIKLNEYDVIYSKNEILEAFIFKFLIRYENLPPVIFGCHTVHFYPIAKSFHAKLHNFLYSSFIYKYLAGGVKKFHVLNSGDEIHLSELFSRGLVAKIYNPFDFKNYLKEGNFSQYSYKFDQDRMNILWVGALTEQKGVDDLIEIINTVNKLGYIEKIMWNICGYGPEEDKILSLSKWQNVNYFGYVENKYMPSIYKQNSLFISTSHWEGFPYNLLEAQSAGLPVLAYNISGCNDIIDNKVNGILAEDISQFKNEIINFIDGKYKFCDINKYIAQKFNSDAIYKQLIDLFKSVVEEK